MTRSHGSGARITAVLGPTNTGKTHLALERMMARSSGVMGLPLRLLARELYDRVVRVKGAHAAALITGEEKIVPAKARYFLCTAEAMPLDMRPAFVGLDEIQLAADPERGHVFTQRLLQARGAEETMFMGASSTRPLIRRLVPEAVIEERERFSVLSYAGPKKLARLPRRTAIVAFSSEDVYAIAELMRRQRGGAAVVTGALSPRTRNAQVALYQSGQADFLVATDAIGMGLNMDVDHVAFAALSKFDGRRRRRLLPHEIGQIAGRAGRFRSDGSFGETGDARPLDPDVIARVEEHDFEPLSRLVWRNSALDLSSLESLRATLDAPSPDPVLERVRRAVDEDVLDLLSRDREVRERVAALGGAARLWDVCRTPDFRKTTIDDHARLVKTVFMHLTGKEGRLPDALMEGQLARVSKTGGDVSALAQRLAHVRTWAYAANRKDWTADPACWQARCREVEDRLSDALHERLTERFIDRRTSALMRGLREKSDLEAGLDAAGEVTVEGHFVGRLKGLSFRPDAAGGPLARRAVTHAAMKAVRPEINRRLGRLARAGDGELELRADGVLVWEGEPVARLEAGPDPFAPCVRLIGAELGSGEAASRAAQRLEQFAAALAETRLAPLLSLRNLTGDAAGLDGLARGIAYRLAEGFGSAPRAVLAADIDALSARERRQLRAAGVRIGEHAVFMPALLKPRAASLNALYRAVHLGGADNLLRPAPGLTSAPAEAGRPGADYAAAGFQLCGPRAVRLDILERLADLIREARKQDPQRRFEPGPAMTSLLGCSPEDLRGVLKALGYRRVRKPDGAAGELWDGRKHAVRTRPDMAAARPEDAAASPFAALARLPVAQEQARKPRARKPRKPSARARASGRS